MRYIKFRGKRLCNGEWVRGNFYQNLDGTCFIGICRGVIRPGKRDSSRWYKVDPNTVGQYSGFNDYLGNCIYEGDIISFVDDRPYGTVRKNGTVIFENGQFDFTNAKFATWESLKMDNGNYDCRIEGNIYNNPKLLDE